MHKLELNDAQKTLLTEVLELDLKNLTDEISHTEDHDYRHGLVQRQEQLTGILTALKAL